MPRIWTLSLSDPWFDYVESGHKTYEGRLYRGLPQYFQVGDTIHFYHDTNTIRAPITVNITTIHRFDSFQDSLIKLPLDKVLPDVSSIEHGVQVYLKFASNESQKRYGVCQIEVKIRQCLS